MVGETLRWIICSSSNKFGHCFDKKVTNVRKSPAYAADERPTQLNLTICPRYRLRWWHSWIHLCTPNKQSTFEQLPMLLLKDCIGTIAPFIIKLVNGSIATAIQFHYLQNRNHDFLAKQTWLHCGGTTIGQAQTRLFLSEMLEIVAVRQPVNYVYSVSIGHLCCLNFFTLTFTLRHR